MKYLDKPCQPLAKRFGITTGTCAAAAAKAAALAFCNRPVPKSLDIKLPDGRCIKVKVQGTSRLPDGSSQGVVLKYSGEDQDVTDGVRVIVRLAPLKGHGKIIFRAGKGVGVVQKPGLQVAIGQPAINPVPRAMIEKAVREITARSMKATISIPGGDKLAQGTFNPRLGIKGGLSILGTTGIVKPRCRKAMQDAISCALNVAEASAVCAPVFVPGNVGFQAARRRFALADEQTIEAGNEWKFVLKEAARRSFAHWLILGHPGKLAKFITGQWNTHSADSSPAIDIVRAAAGKIFHRRHSAAAKTVEGFLTFFSADERSVLANELAARIAQSIRIAFRPRAGIAVFLCNMQGDELGRYGDCSAWQSKKI